MKIFEPDYRNVVDAAYNRKPKRIPLYEHIISPEIMERIQNNAFRQYENTDPDAYFRSYNGFCRDMGYDVVPFEECITDILPGGGALAGNKQGCIQTREDFERYPWDEVEKIYFERYGAAFEAMRRQLPPGMRAVGGVGNGVFECVQDLVGYTSLCYLSVDDPDLYEALFEKAGDLLTSIWTHFLDKYGDAYCVCRFGDDLGFHSSTLLSEEDVTRLILPQYKRIVKLVHTYEKPFLLHSCGCIFGVMDALIQDVKIDAKHSNEDSIAPFSRWIEAYGDRIGNFGGLDTNVLCDIDNTDLERYVTDKYQLAAAKQGGVALGSGNSIPNYVSPEKYRYAVNLIRELRGE